MRATARAIPQLPAKQGVSNDAWSQAASDPECASAITVRTAPSWPFRNQQERRDGVKEPSTKHLEPKTTPHSGMRCGEVPPSLRLSVSHSIPPLLHHPSSYHLLTQPRRPPLRAPPPSTKTTVSCATGSYRSKAVLGPPRQSRGRKASSTPWLRQFQVRSYGVTGELQASTVHQHPSRRLSTTGYLPRWSTLSPTQETAW